MTWIIVIGAIFIGLLMWPVLLEWRRTSVEQLRHTRPGQLAHLSQGLTYYQWSGPEEGPVIVCVHGRTTPSYVWDGVVGELTSRGYRVLKYDLYGRGVSDRAKGAQTGAFFERQFLDLLDNQNIRTPVVLLGYSMGGAIAAHIAANNPKRVERAVFIAPAGLGYDPGGTSRLFARAGLLGNWLQIILAGKSLRGYVAEEAERVVPVAPDIHQRMAQETYSKGFAMADLSSVRHLLKGDLAAQHQKISENGTPVQIVWGEDDDLIPLSGRDWLQNINPTATHVVIKDCGHEIPYAYPEKLVQHISEFLGGAPKR